MNALSESYYSRYAQARRAEAQRTIDRHAVCAYTGVCLGCGRPGPCAEGDQARRTLARFSRPTNHSVHHPANQLAHRSAGPVGDRSQRPPDHDTGDRLAPGGAGSMTGSLANTAIRTADGTVEPLRAACLAIVEAADRAGQQLDGVGHELARTTLTSLDSALELAWESLTTVYAGLAEARHLPGAEPYRVGDVLAGLGEARLRAVRATAEVHRVRRQLTTAEDRLRRAHADPQAHAAARRWAVAGSRLDLAAARLALGTRALDHYSARLAGTPEPPAVSVTARLERLLTRARPTGAQTSDGARAAALLVIRRRPWGGWRGFLARWRHESWKEFTRPWTA